MNYVQLTPGQTVQVMPKRDATPAQAILSTMEFVKAASLECAELLYDGFTMGVYPDSDHVQLLTEYKWWKENPQKRIDNDGHILS